jgi:hypothetical protein
MQTEKILAALSTVSFIAVIVVNALANTLPINGLNTGEVSALYPSMFTPSGITFSIWSVIYLLLAGFVIYQWKLLSKSYYKQLMSLFIISCALNICWILVWHHLFVSISVIVMIVFLIILIRIFLLLQKNPEQSTTELVLIHLPFTIYLAWISVATIANVSAYLTSIDWDGGILSPVAWTIIMMVVASILAIIVLKKFYRYAYAIVVAWALAGIALNNYPIITVVAEILLFVVIAFSLYLYFTTRRGFSD